MFVYKSELMKNEHQCTSQTVYCFVGYPMVPLLYKSSRLLKKVRSSHIFSKPSLTFSTSFSNTRTLSNLLSKSLRSSLQASAYLQNVKTTESTISQLITNTLCNHIQKRDHYQQRRPATNASRRERLKRKLEDGAKLLDTR